MYETASSTQAVGCWQWHKHLGKIFVNEMGFTRLRVAGKGATCVQSALDSLKAWSDLWQLRLSVPKCSSLFLAGQSNYVDVHQLHIANNAIIHIMWLKI